MKLEYTHERQKVIDGLIKKSFKIDKLYVHDQENTDDWVSNMEILKNLFSINDLIIAEKIFFNALGEMEEVRTRNEEEKDIYMGIVYEHLTNFIDTLLLHTLEYSYDDLANWQFKTEIGKKFHKDVTKKLDALIKKYQDLYNL